IIIKKIKKGGGGHHGGAWKVAYADFVTAMMAFFLLLWLLNVTTEEAKNAIANYFDPTHPTLSSSESGSGGVLGGLTVTTDGAMAQMAQPVTAAQMTGASRNATKVGDTGEDNPEMSEAEVEKLKEEFEAEESQRFEEAKKEIEEALQNDPALQELMKNVMIDITPEGLRIQIIDQEGRPMFASGSAEMYDYTRKLMVKVGEIILKMPNELSIRGHTDSTPYGPNATYTNWELSADRANSTRRILLANKIPEMRLANIMGKGDREHLVPDAKDPRNRRISIILLKETLEAAFERGAFKDKVKAGSKLDQDLKKQVETYKKTQGAVHFP
ncbi:MAG TPA: flagellar motor protein MotB, partial [Micavibrio sp.]